MAPLLITLTGPSASGKSYLFEKLLKLGFNSLVSTTTRAKRSGEVEGENYFYISEDESIEIEQANGFAELIEFNGVRYGITHEEMSKKFSDTKPIVSILTPEGVDIYRHLVDSYNGEFISFYVYTSEAVRIQRLNDRLVKDLQSVLATKNVICKKTIATHTSRIIATVTQERTWKLISYDLTVSGENAEETVQAILKRIESVKNGKK